MSILLFIAHHWLLIAVVVLAIAACVAQPVLAAAFVRNHWQQLILIVTCVVASLYFEHVGARQQASADSALIAKKNIALTNAALQLKAAGDALRAQDVANAQRIKDAEQATRDANAAKKDADKAADRMAAQIAGFGKRLDAARKNPPCAVLLSTDVAKVCGL